MTNQKAVHVIIGVIFLWVSPLKLIQIHYRPYQQKYTQ